MYTVLAASRHYNNIIYIAVAENGKMKIPALLSKYLFATKKLNLAGIGSFIIENEDLQNIVFTQDVSLKMDKELIAFVSSQTGKMKSLSKADLESHFDLIAQFLNIGKPFFFEGIGTLVKPKSGIFQFTPEIQKNEKLKTKEAVAADFKSILYLKYSSYKKRLKIVFTITIILLISFSIWQGYKFYIEKNKSNKADFETTNSKTEPFVQVDSIDILQVKDTLNAQIEYQFIIEEATQQRASIRYNLLKSYGLDIKIKTEDSLKYILYFSVKAFPSDTLKIRDSLSAMYVNPNFMKTGKALIE